MCRKVPSNQPILRFYSFRSFCVYALQVQDAQPSAPCQSISAPTAFPAVGIHATPLPTTAQGRPGRKPEPSSQPARDIKVEPASQQAAVKAEAVSQRVGPASQQAAVKREVLSQQAAGSMPGGAGQAARAEGADGAVGGGSAGGRGALRELPGGPGQRPVATRVAVRVTPHSYSWGCQGRGREGIQPAWLDDVLEAPQLYR